MFPSFAGPPRRASPQYIVCMDRVPSSIYCLIGYLRRSCRIFPQNGAPTTPDNELGQFPTNRFLFFKLLQFFTWPRKSRAKEMWKKEAAEWLDNMQATRTTKQSERIKQRERVKKFFHFDSEEIWATCQLCYGQYRYEDGAELGLHLELQHPKDWEVHLTAKNGSDTKDPTGVLTFFTLDEEDETTAECNLCERSFELEEEGYSVLEIHMSNKHDEEWAAHIAQKKQSKFDTADVSPSLVKMQETLEGLVEEVSALRKEQHQINRKLRKSSESSGNQDKDDEPPKKKTSPFGGGEFTGTGNGESSSEPTRSSMSLYANPTYLRKKNEDCQYYQMSIRRVIDNLVRNIKEILPNNEGDTAVSSFMRSLKEISSELRPADRVYFNDSTLFGIVAKHAAEDLHEVPKNALRFLRDCSESHESIIDNFLMGGVLPSLRTAFMRHWANGGSSTIEILLILQIYRNIAPGIHGRRDDIIIMLGAAAEQAKNIAFNLKNMLFGTLCFMLEAEVGDGEPSQKLKPLVELIEKEVKTWKMPFPNAFEEDNSSIFVKLLSNSTVPAFQYFAAWSLAAVSKMDESRVQKRLKLDEDDVETLTATRNSAKLAEDTKDLIDKVLTQPLDD